MAAEQSYGTEVWISACLLFFVNLINYMDRFTVSGVLPLIEDDFGITEEWKGGLLQTAFIICYFLSAPVFGYFGDRYSRKCLIIFGIFMWGTCTLVSSFMKDYVPFLLWRASMGFGEAGFTSIAPTVLADYFRSKTLTVVLAAFYFAIPVGSGMGYMVGSKIAAAAGNDWRWGVRFTTLMNAVALIMMLIFLQDPPRGKVKEPQSLKPPPDIPTNNGDAMDGQSIKRSRKLAWVNDLIRLGHNKTFVLSTLAYTSFNFSTGGFAWWGPHYFESGLKMRHVSSTTSDQLMDEEDVFFVFGLIMSVAGVCGLVMGSGASYVFRRKVRWADPVICGTGLVISAPFISAAILICAVDVRQAMGLIFCGEVFLNMNWAVVVDMTMYVVPPSRRSTAQAFQLMASHAFGEAGSPYLLGLLTDFFKKKAKMDGSYDAEMMSEDELEYWSFQKTLLITLGFQLLAAVIFFFDTAFVVTDWDTAIKEEKEQQQMELQRRSTEPADISHQKSADQFNC